MLLRVLMLSSALLLPAHALCQEAIPHPPGGGGGSGDVTGPASSTNEAIPIFDGTTGKLLKQDSGLGFNAAGDDLTVGDKVTAKSFESTCSGAAGECSTDMTWNTSTPSPPAASISRLWSNAVGALRSLLIRAGNAIASIFLSTNVPLDTDNDGAPDLAYAGDWDGDGTLEMTDVHAALVALTDTGAKHLKILPGLYTPNTTANTSGLLELVNLNHVTIEGMAGAVLQGRNLADADSDMSILYVSGSTDVAIIGPLELSGRMPASFDTGSATGCVGGTEPCNFLFRMGVRIAGSTRVRVEGLYIHDVLAQGIYSVGSSDVEIIGNRVEKIGGYGDAGVHAQPGIYVYVTSAPLDVARGIRIVKNTLKHVVFGILTRRDLLTGRISNVYVGQNTIEHATNRGIKIGGSENVVVQGNTVLRTLQAFQLENGASGFYEADLEPNRNVTIADNFFLGTTAAATPAVELNEFNTGVKYLRNVIEGSAGQGLYYEAPQRGLVVQGGVIAHTVGAGVLEVGTFGATNQERVRVSGLTIGPVDDEDADHPLFLGVMTESQANALTCNLDFRGYWLRTSNAGSADDVTFGSGTGSFVSAAECGASGWAPRTAHASTTPRDYALDLRGGPGGTYENISVKGTTLSPVIVREPNLAGSVFRGFTIDGTNSHGFLGELASPPTCDGYAEGWWYYDTTGTDDNLRKRCIAGTWTTITDQQTSGRHGVILPAMTGKGPTLKGIHCQDLDGSSSCVLIPGSTAATDGRIGATARYRTSEEGDTDATTMRTDYVVDIQGTAIGDGWLIEGEFGCDNCENAVPINNAGANQPGFVGDYRINGDPTSIATELCDHASETSSTLRRMDATTNLTALYACEDNAGTRAWDAKD